MKAMDTIELLIKIKSFAGAISGASPGDNEFIDDIKKDVDQAIALLQEPCEWKTPYGHGFTKTACGNEILNPDSWQFCPFCGKRTKEQR